MADSGEIEFVNEWAIEKRLHIVHGNNLDDLMQMNNLLKLELHNQDQQTLL